MSWDERKQRKGVLCWRKKRAVRPREALSTVVLPKAYRNKGGMGFPSSSTHSAPNHRVRGTMCSSRTWPSRNTGFLGKGSIYRRAILP